MGSPEYAKELILEIEHVLGVNSKEDLYKLSEKDGWYYNPNQNEKGSILYRKNKEYHTCPIYKTSIIFTSGMLRWFYNGKAHNICGPYEIFHLYETSYSINNELCSEEQYWKHPLVVEYKLNRILEHL